ncbi:hypothetical protein ACFQL7_25085 [Halocatena marina]|uniref:Dihydrofolate reductase n=1 Tax=Halocatena marina TaxID=2934937 RepID=A0ABD5YY14_9EURY
MTTSTNEQPAMQGKVTVDMSISLDGYIAGPNDGPENPLGDGGGRLHKWVYDLRAGASNRGSTAARPIGTPRSWRNRPRTLVLS